MLENGLLRTVRSRGVRSFWSTLGKCNKRLHPEKLTPLCKEQGEIKNRKIPRVQHTQEVYFAKRHTMPEFTYSHNIMKIFRELLSPSSRWSLWVNPQLEIVWPGVLFFHKNVLSWSPNVIAGGGVPRGRRRLNHFGPNILVALNVSSSGLFRDCASPPITMRTKLDLTWNRIREMVIPSALFFTTGFESGDGFSSAFAFYRSDQAAPKGNRRPPRRRMCSGALRFVGYILPSTQSIVYWFVITGVVGVLLFCYNMLLNISNGSSVLLYYRVHKNIDRHACITMHACMHYHALLPSNSQCCKHWTPADPVSKFSEINMINKLQSRQRNSRWVRSGRLFLYAWRMIKNKYCSLCNHRFF